jgi:hypothetical protein
MSSHRGLPVRRTLPTLSMAGAGGPTSADGLPGLRTGGATGGLDTTAAIGRGPAVALSAIPAPAPVVASTGVDAGAELAPVLLAPDGTPLPQTRELAPVLLAPDGTPLPQTRERPSTESRSFRRRLEWVVDAIVQDDPERALPAFFPRVAYEQVKAIADPGRDWQERLWRAFQRDVHEYHRSLGPDAASARLAGLVTNENAVRWIDPGREGNRLGYYRVTRSRLRFRWANGTVRDIELTSLISWRGEWYVVHLHGFG